MTAIQPEVDLGTALPLVVFGLSLSYVVIGNFILYRIMKRKGSKIGFLDASNAILEYFYESPRVRSKALDRFAHSLVLAIPEAVATAAFAFPRVAALGSGA